MEGLMNCQMIGWQSDGWVDGWIDKQMDRYMDGQMDRQIVSQKYGLVD